MLPGRSFVGAAGGGFSCHGPPRVHRTAAQPLPVTVDAPCPTETHTQPSCPPCAANENVSGLPASPATRPTVALACFWKPDTPTRKLQSAG